MKQHYFSFFIIFFITPFVLKAQSPIEFVENRGQWDAPFAYKSVSSGGDVYLEKNGFTYMVGASQNGKLVHDFKHKLIKNPPLLRFHAYKIILEGASKDVKITGRKQQNHYYNYFLGNDPEKWKSEIHPCLAVDYTNIYPGIDLHIASEKNNLKYDFIVQPGANPEIVQMKYDGDDGLAIRKNNLEIKTSVGTVTELQPYAYQYINGEKVEVPCRYKLKGKTVGYYFPKDYDHSERLVIDPVVVFATYSGSTADNWGFTATYDNAGNFYAGGIANGIGYPTTTGAFQTTFGGGGPGGGNGGPPSHNWDIVISKINPLGTGFIFSTYLGGADNEQPHSMIVDANNDLVVAGRTYSNNFPTTTGAYDNSHNGNADIVVTKFNPAGSALIGSTYIGGSFDDCVNISSLWGTVTDLKHNYGDDARSEVIVDNAGNVYVAAETFSTNFPTVNALQSNLQGGQDGVVFKLNSNLSALLWSTYLGGTGNDAAFVLALSASQSHVFVAGGTSSPGFPSTAGTLNPNYLGGSADGYILKFQNSGSYTLQRGTFIGANNYDQCYGIQVDNNNKVYAMGQTLGGAFPVSAGVYSNPGSSQFVIKLDSNLSSIDYSTVFGSGNSFANNISPVAFLVDTCEQVYISGWGGTLAGNGGDVFGMPITSNAVMPTTTDGADFYFIVFSKNATNLLYATYYGAPTLGEHVDGGTSRFDKSGVVYQGICAGCGGSNAFPTTTPVISNTNNGPNCNYGALKIAFQLSYVDAKANVTNNDTMGCPPFTVHVVNNSSNGATYEWDFGDGGPGSTAQNPPPHTYYNPGTYIIRLIVNNTAACNVQTDTDYVKVIVDTNSIKTNFDFVILDTCDKPFEVSFTNTSKYSNTPGAQNFTKFYWNFGDGNSFTGPNPPIHAYADTGTYTISLLMIDTTSCNERDSVQKTFTIRNAFVYAGFEADSGCIGTGVLFSNQSINYQTASWDFGDGNTSTAHSPLHNYKNPGAYTITLIAGNPNSCNKADTVVHSIEIFASPIADFSFVPVPPEVNMPIKFTNKSKNAVRYLWDFGDGRSGTIEHPEHLYRKTGTYLACLTAFSKDNCIHKVCKKVDALIKPAVDVPTGFTPNNDGKNDILTVRGGAIEFINFKIFNRWGEKVFEVIKAPANDPKYGWDGTYKGKPQEMEAYAWVLDAVFIDGTTVSKTGNVTLIR